MITTWRLIFANANLGIFRVDLFLQEGKYDKVYEFAKNLGKSVKINLALIIGKINLFTVPSWNWYS